MNKGKGRTALVGLLVGVTLLAGGCTAMIHGAVLSFYPKYEEVQKAWPSLEGDKGRIVVMWPRLPLAGFNPIGVGGFGSVNLAITGATVTPMKTTLLDETFVFADLAPLTYTVEISTGGWFGKTSTVQVPVERGKTSYVLVQTTNFSKQPPKVIDETTALPALKDLHHNYKEPVPFPEQTKGATPAG